MTAASRPVRKLLPTLALVLGSILVSVAAAEVALRVAGFEPRQASGDAGFESWAAPDAALGWVNRAGTWKSAELGNLPMTFEADGWRHDAAGEKPASLPRILVVGCSLTQGYGVADDQT